jgi:hypothetical protein
VQGKSIPSSFEARDLEEMSQEHKQVENFKTDRLRTNLQDWVCQGIQSFKHKCIQTAISMLI